MEVMVRFEYFKSGDGLRGTAGLHEMPRRRSEIELQSQLNLARIVDGARRTVKSVRGTFRVGSGAGAAEGGCIQGAEIRSTVNGVEVTNVQCVGKVEGLGDEFEAASFAEGKLAGDAHVHGTEIVSDKGVARFDADAVVVVEDVAIGVKTGEFSKAQRRLDGGDYGEEEIPADGAPAIGSRNRAIEHQALANIVAREGAFGAEVVAAPFVYTEKTTVVDRVPAGGRFEIDPEWELTDRRRTRTGRNKGTINVFRASASLRVVERNGGGGVGLVHVEEAAEVNPAHMENAQADRGVRQGFEFDSETRLNTVRILVILNETYSDHVKGDRRVSAVDGERVKQRSHGGRIAAEGKGPRRPVQGILEGTSGKFSLDAATDGPLASEQRRRDHPVKEAEAGAHDDVVFGADVVGHAEARIEIFPLGVKDIRRPCFPFPPQAAIHGQAVGGAPFVLNVEAVVAMIESSFGLITDRRRNRSALKGGGINGRFGEIGCGVKTFEEN